LNQPPTPPKGYKLLPDSTPLRIGDLYFARGNASVAVVSSGTVLEEWQPVKQWRAIGPEYWYARKP